MLVGRDDGLGLGALHEGWNNLSPPWGPVEVVSIRSGREERCFAANLATSGRTEPCSPLFCVFSFYAWDLLFSGVSGSILSTVPTRMLEAKSLLGMAHRRCPGAHVADRTIGPGGWRRQGGVGGGGGRKAGGAYCLTFHEPRPLFLLMASATSSLSPGAENLFKQQPFALGLLALSFTMTEAQQPAQEGRSLLLLELHSAFAYLTFSMAIVLSALSLHPPGEDAPAAALIHKWGPPVALVSVSTAFVLRSCLALPHSSLLRVWFFLLAMVLVVSLLFLAWIRWKDRSAVQDTSKVILPVVGRRQDPIPPSFLLPDLGSSPCSFSGPGGGKTTLALTESP